MFIFRVDRKEVFCPVGVLFACQLMKAWARKPVTDTSLVGQLPPGARSSRDSVRFRNGDEDGQSV